MEINTAGLCPKRIILQFLDLVIIFKQILILKFRIEGGFGVSQAIISAPAGSAVQKSQVKNTAAFPEVPTEDNSSNYPRDIYAHLNCTN